MLHDITENASERGYSQNARTLINPLPLKGWHGVCFLFSLRFDKLAASEKHLPGLFLDEIFYTKCNDRFSLTVISGDMS